MPLAELTLTGTGHWCYDYQPVRPSVGRQALAWLPIQDFEGYTFVDVGSGKGRILLVAAEFPFQKIRGIEFAIELHRQAERNIARYRHSGQRCTDLESIDIDASHYVFPESKLILYLFNPSSPRSGCGRSYLTCRGRLRSGCVPPSPIRCPFFACFLTQHGSASTRRLTAKT